MRFLVTLICALAAAGAAAQARLTATVAASATVPAAGARGFSAVNALEDGSYSVLEERMVFHHLYIDWQGGRARILDSHTLNDAGRALARSDLNLDGMQTLGDSLWFADERGPYLVETDRHGRLLGKYAVLVDGAVAKSEALRRGFAGLAASRDGRFLYAAFEGALWLGGAREADADGRESVRVLEFDVPTRRWSGRTLRYRLDANGNSIADLRFVDRRTLLVVERGAQSRRIYRVLVEGDRLIKAAFVELPPDALPSVEGIDIIEPGYVVLSSAERRVLVLLHAPDLLFPAFERSRP